MLEKINKLENDLKSIQLRLNDLGYDMSGIVQSEFKKRWRVTPQSEAMFGMMTAVVVDTIDPWKQNRIRFYSPYFSDPKTTAVKSLPWANPISSMGGFDDNGLNWVPPAGSTVCIIFENGDRGAPYYIGTTWHRDRGPLGQHDWGYNVKEFYDLHAGDRDGYYVGEDHSQVFPPWNTENYNAYDLDSKVDMENDPEAQKNITAPNIYGFKTPQKCMVKLVDGDYNCNHKDSRLEMMSSSGQWMIFKDDNVHPMGHWAHTDACDGGEFDYEECKDPSKVNCKEVEEDPQCTNPYFKHKSETRPYRGPGTPQNNRANLPQTGIQFLSYAGHSFRMDDSVEEPRIGQTGWKKSITPFDWGCNDKFIGKIEIASVTGHKITLSDKEEDTELRGDENYIKFESATGNSIELNDHYRTKKIAGERNGITMRTNSNHSFEMLNEDNENEVQPRREGGQPVPKAKKAFIRLRSGYGLEFLMKDEASQEQTDKQYIQVLCPQKDADVGPHIFRLQEDPNGGQVFLKAAGDHITVTDGIQIDIVGDENGPMGPQNKVIVTSDNFIKDTKNLDYSSADIHLLKADKMALIMAGEDCPDEDGNMGPCLGPILVLTEKGVVASDRVFASASPSSPCISLFHLSPLAKC